MIDPRHQRHRRGRTCATVDRIPAKRGVLVGPPRRPRAPSPLKERARIRGEHEMSWMEGEAGTHGMKLHTNPRDNLLPLKLLNRLWYEFVASEEVLSVKRPMPVAGYSPSDRRSGSARQC
jgi:hypothetical protein